MTYEKYIAIDFVTRLANRFGPASRLAAQVPSWVERLTDIEMEESQSSAKRCEWWVRVRQTLAELRSGMSCPEDEPALQNAKLLCAHFGLDDLETNILAFFFLHYRIFDDFEDIIDAALHTKDVNVRFLLTQFCAADDAAIARALWYNAPLASLGLLTKGTMGGARSMGAYSVSSLLETAIKTDASTVEDLLKAMLPPASATQAEWQDFEGLGHAATIVREMLAAALAQGVKGMNILFYGPPGTGKTEFCKVLAQEVGAHLCTVGEASENRQEPSRHERLSDLVLAGQTLTNRRDTVLLLDEMEDILTSDGRNLHGRATSKIYFNRLLETNPIPTLWTTNDIRSCDPAFLRRMSFSIEMRAPKGAVRAKIWQRLQARHWQDADSADLHDMAQTHAHAPALVSDAMRAAQLCADKHRAFSSLLAASGKLIQGGAALPPEPAPSLWQPELAATDVDLARLEARMLEIPSPARVSFCLDGPAGTGKSAWARHLAQKMGLPVLQKRASDILSMWVGGSEKAIAAAFAEAREEGAMLIFDEADSLLADRRSAQRTWEVSQVNEMLTWMGNHPLPFVCTTNLVQNLDPATQRRFTFRIRFGYLSPPQLAAAWAHYFAVPVPAGLAALVNLAPGDFANVARRTRALGETAGAAILAELHREADAKEHAPALLDLGVDFARAAQDRSP